MTRLDALKGLLSLLLDDLEAHRVTLQKDRGTIMSQSRFGEWRGFKVVARFDSVDFWRSACNVQVQADRVPTEIADLVHRIWVTTDPALDNVMAAYMQAMEAPC